MVCSMYDFLLVVMSGNFLFRLTGLLQNPWRSSVKAARGDENASKALRTPPMAALLASFGQSKSAQPCARWSLLLVPAIFREVVGDEQGFQGVATICSSRDAPVARWARDADFPMGAGLVQPGHVREPTDCEPPQPRDSIAQIAQESVPARLAKAGIVCRNDSHVPG